MRLGLLIPTAEEARGLDSRLADCAAVGYGPGKATSCAAAADLVFQRHCDTILIFGTAGGISQRALTGTAFLADKVAYNDYDIRPVFGATDVGFVPDFTDDDGWFQLNFLLNDRLEKVIRDLYPELTLHRGLICSADKFLLPDRREDYNRIEAKADCIDMESASVAEFCHRLNQRLGLKISTAVLRIVSNPTSCPSAASDFLDFLAYFDKFHAKLHKLFTRLSSEPI